MREVNLLGQNVNAYRGPTFDGNDCTFAELLRLVAAIDGIDRIRYTTSHPIEFTDDIIEVYKDTPEVVSFLHLPVQSGSDRILTMMKRPHTVLEYKSKIPPPARRPSRHHHEFRLHRRLPERDGRGFRGHHEAHRGD